MILKYLWDKCVTLMKEIVDVQKLTAQDEFP